MLSLAHSDLCKLVVHSSIYWTVSLIDDSLMVMCSINTHYADSVPVPSCHDIIQPDVWPCDFPPPPCEGRTDLLLPGSNLDLYLACDVFGDGDLGWLSLTCAAPCYKSYSSEYIVRAYGVWDPLPACNSELIMQQYRIASMQSADHEWLNDSINAAYLPMLLYNYV